MVEIGKRRRPKGARPRKDRDAAQHDDRSGDRRAQANPGRVAAVRALVAVDEGRHLEEVLPELLPEDPRDRALGWFLAFGVLRTRGQLDAALRPLLHQVLADLDPAVRATLRVGAFETYFGRAKAHAVVSQAVEAARSAGVGRASGLVNAVLRKLPEAPPVHANHPLWLVERWRGRYGEAAEAWLVANGEPPPVFIVAPNGLPDGLEGESVSVEGEHGDPTVVPHVYRVTPSGPVPDLPGFDAGAFWVQDLAAVRVADLVADAVGEGSTVLDACAAPGGKSFRMISRGLSVTAVDKRSSRLAPLREGVARLGFELTAHAHDWTKGPMPEGGTFDAVLVDAPCTGLGTVRRHPEIRWRRQPSDLERAPQLQGQILSAAANHVAPGGVLVYAVCSPEPEEGRDVVRVFLERHPDFVQEAALDTAPPVQGEDAHAAVRLRRSGGASEGRP